MGGGPVTNVVGVVDGRKSSSGTNDKKSKKGSGKERRKADRRAKAEREERENEEFEEFMSSKGGAPSSSSSKGRKAKKAAAPRDASGAMAKVTNIATRLVGIAFLLLVLSRRDFATAFGAGTGKNIVRATPVSIAAMKLNDLSFIKKNSKFRNAAWKLSKALMVPAVAERELFPKKSRKSKRKSKGKKKQKSKTTPSWLHAAEKDLLKVTKDASFRATVGGNGFLLVGSALTLLGAILVAINPRTYFIAALGMGTFFAGTLGLQQQQPLNPQTALFVGFGLIAALFALVPDSPEEQDKAKKKKQ